MYLGDDAINLPPGPSFAVLPSPDSPWPTPPPGGHDPNVSFQGYRTDKTGQPTFLYRFGEIQIEETPLPIRRLRD